MPEPHFELSGLSSSILQRGSVGLLWGQNHGILKYAQPGVSLIRLQVPHVCAICESFIEGGHVQTVYLQGLSS